MILVIRVNPCDSWRRIVTSRLQACRFRPDHPASIACFRLSMRPGAAFAQSRHRIACPGPWAPAASPNSSEGKLGFRRELGWGSSVQMNLSFTKTPSLRTSVVTAHASSLELLVWPCVFTGLRCWSVVREIDGLQLQDMRDWRMDEA